MLIKCEECNKEYEAKTKRSKYCSDVCRKLAFRPKKDATIPIATIPATESATELKEITVTLQEVCAPEELKKFPNMCETKKESKEAIYRLENNNLEVLKANKIFIPNWREKIKNYDFNQNSVPPV